MLAFEVAGLSGRPRAEGLEVPLFDEQLVLVLLEEEADAGDRERRAEAQSRRISSLGRKTQGSRAGPGFHQAHCVAKKTVIHLRFAPITPG